MNFLQSVKVPPPALQLIFWISFTWFGFCTVLTPIPKIKKRNWGFEFLNFRVKWRNNMHNKSKEDFKIIIISHTREIMFLSMKCQINITLLDNFFSFYLHHVFYNFKFEVTYNNYFDIQIRKYDNMDTNDNIFLFNCFCLPLYFLSVYYFIIFLLLNLS